LSIERDWYAVFTTPQHEKSVMKHLDLRHIESFLPTFEATRFWKNRQKVKVVLPLFPTYLFVRIGSQERRRVLESPGVITIVGNGRGFIPVAGNEIESLRAAVSGHRVKPFHDLVVGKRVRINGGMMRGIEGTLVRKNNTWEFALTVDAIEQHVSILVDASEIEPVHR